MKKYLLLFVKGMAMGAADVVPGVSGGTIAFITGIYEELLGTIKELPEPQNLQHLLKGQWKKLWLEANLRFLVILFGGIGLSILLMAEQIHYLLEYYPIAIWAFFFGLIVASVVVIAGQVRQWSLVGLLTLVIGALIAYYVAAQGTTASETTSVFYIFFCGLIAICAMILPGISGSFILVLLGAYELVLGSIKGIKDALLAGLWDEVWAKLQIVLAFLLGAIIGLFSFARVVSWLFKHYRQPVITGLMGFLIGSLYAVWPWKEIRPTGVEGKDFLINISPYAYQEGDPQLGLAIILAIVGFILVYGIERLGQRT